MNSYVLNVDNLMAECALLLGFERRVTKIGKKLETTMEHLIENRKNELLKKKSG